MGTRPPPFAPHYLFRRIVGGMAETRTPRFSLPQWSQGADKRPGRVETNAIHQLIETQAGRVYPSGLYKDRPTTNIFGAFYMATDQGTEGRLYYNGGSGWVALNTVGGGGAGRPVVIAGTATEGASLFAARADHTHVIPLATKTNAGAMPAQWAEMMGNATSQAVAGSIALRDSGGRLLGAKPTAAAHLATKDYVDTAGSSGPQPGLAARNSAGQLSVSAPTHALHAANKAYVDSRYMESSPYAVKGRSTLIERWSGGTGGNVEDPTKPLELANKRYVDGRASRREWKTNVRELRDPLGMVQALEPVVFDYTPDAPASGCDVIGGIVEDVHRVSPLLTMTDDDGVPERIRTGTLEWVLVGAVQALTEQVEELSEELDRVYDLVRGGNDA